MRSFDEDLLALKYINAFASFSIRYSKDVHLRPAANSLVQCRPSYFLILPVWFKGKIRWDKTYFRKTIIEKLYNWFVNEWLVCN